MLISVNIDVNVNIVEDRLHTVILTNCSLRSQSLINPQIFSYNIVILVVGIFIYNFIRQFFYIVSFL